MSPDADTPIQNLRVLAATDFRDSSMAACTWAFELAQQFNLPLVLAHVVEPLTVPPQWQSYVQETDEKRVADARARLAGLGRKLCSGRACEAVVSRGRPAESLAAIATEHRAGLIVMGLRGKHDVSARRPGSVAYAVLRIVNVPVLVVPAANDGAGSG